MMRVLSKRVTFAVGGLEQIFVMSVVLSTY